MIASSDNCSASAAVYSPLSDAVTLSVKVSESVKEGVLLVNVIFTVSCIDISSLFIAASLPTIVATTTSPSVTTSIDELIVEPFILYEKKTVNYKILNIY